MGQSEKQSIGSLGADSQQPSLVDATVTLIKRWPFFAALFILITLMFVFFAWQKHVVYDFVSVYKPASLASGAPLESSDSIVLTLENVIVPGFYEDIVGKNPQQTSLLSELDVESPRKAELVLLHSEGGIEQQSEVNTVHAEVIARLKSQQEKRLAIHKSSLEEKLKSVREVLKNIDSKVFAEAYAEAKQTEASLSASLLELSSGEALVLARAKEKTSGLTRSRVLILGLLVAFMFSLFFVFFIEFCARVRDRLHN